MIAGIEFLAVKLEVVEGFFVGNPPLIIYPRTTPQEIL